MAFAIFSARIRIPLLAVAGLMILLGVVMDRLWVSNVGFVALIIGLALYFRVGTVRKEPLSLQRYRRREQAAEKRRSLRV